MQRIAAACIVAICSASTGSATDLVTKAPSQELISQSSTSLQSSQASNQQAFVFGDWGGLRSWLNNRGIDLGFGYLSESAWDIAGGKARGARTPGRKT
jgi:carbohydrate-selective porin OprB